MTTDDARAPNGLLPVPPCYADWLRDLKERIQSAQQRAALAVNQELVLLYWQICSDILERQAAEVGSKGDRPPCA